MADDLKLLVIDASATDRCRIRRIMEQESSWQCRFLEAETLDQGLDLCRKEIPDVILVDIGLKAVAELAEERGLLSCPVVFIGSPDDEARSAPRADVHEFLDKSAMSGDLLARAIRDSLARFRLAQELRFSQQRLALLADQHKALEDQVRRQAQCLADNDRRKDEFLAMLAHELRNPLAPILSAVQWIDRQRGTHPTVQHAAQVTRRQVEHMARLLDDLLDVSRITRGKIQLRRERLQVKDAIGRAVEATESSLRAHSHRLVVSAPDVPVWLEADQARLEQILVNLLNNAAKFTAPGGQIGIAAAVENGELVIRVSDNGMGISAELLPHVFDMFSQDERTPDRAQGGLGIGLTMVRSLAELHGGQVDVRSEGLGRGAEFTVRLPLPAQETAICDQSPQAAPLETAREPHIRRRVLLVEDNVDAAEMLAALLDLEGFETAVAHDGLTAIEAAVRHRPDAVVIDIGLPGIDGYEVARRLRAQEGFDQVTLLAVTGYGQEEDRRLAAAAGFDHHLVKPVALDALLSLLDRRGAHRNRVLIGGEEIEL